MKKKITFLLLISIIISLFFSFGCIKDKSPEPIDLIEGQIGNYEIDFSGDKITNSTTFFLNTDKKNKTIQVVITIENASNSRISVPKDISMGSKSKKENIIKDLIVTGRIIHDNRTGSDNVGTFSDIPYNTSLVETSRENIINIQFAQPISGFIAYSYPGEYAQFYHYLSNNETITVVLPPGHDAGNIILGSIRPVKPDEKLIDNNNRVRLIWNNPDPKQKILIVKYYKESLPFILSIVCLIIGIGFLITSLYYTNQIRKIKKKQELIESDTKKKK